MCACACACVRACGAGQDHEVQEDKIVLVSLLMAELGVHSVAYAFPKVKIITTAVDKSLDDYLHVIPGIGKPVNTHSLFATVLRNQTPCVAYFCSKQNLFACFESLSP